MEPFQNPCLSPKERATDLLHRLTLREKVGQINQHLYGFSSYIRHGDNFVLTEECKKEIQKWGGLGVLYGLFRADPWSKKNKSNGIPPSLAAKAYNTVQKAVLQASRFQIPMLLTAEASHGMVSVDGYMLPANIAIAATFNPFLCFQGFSVYGQQAAQQGIDYALVSVLDVLREPRWGRSEECFGEDPFLASCMAYQAVKGCGKHGCDVVAKHLCGQGETTGGINSSPCRVGWRELREIHLPPLHGALEAGLHGVMAAYNEIDGVPCHANPVLLQKYLRDECGFKGIVMADGTAIDRLDEITGNSVASGALALQSGVDISLWDNAFTLLEDAVEQGMVSEDTLNTAVLKVLETKFRRGLFENPFLDETKTPTAFTMEDYPQALQIARESVVMLSNSNNVLPLASSAKIALIGPNANSVYNLMGDYSRPLNKNEGISVLDGLNQSIPAEQLHYAQGCSLLEKLPHGIEDALEIAEKSDVIVLVLGGSSNRFEGANFDETGAATIEKNLLMDCGEGVDKADLELPLCQSELFEALVATGKPVVCIVMGGRPYAIGSFAQKATALLYSFYPGMWGGKAIAEILLGQQNPSGRLPASLPRHSGSLPCFYNGKYATKNRVYCDMDSSALYPFGYGLSYTTFIIKDVVVSRSQQSNAAIQVQFNICNIGNHSGFAVPLLYIRWLTGTITSRKKELKAFEKIWLAVNEEKNIALQISAKNLHRWNNHCQWEMGNDRLLLMLEESGQMFYHEEIQM